MDNNRQRPSLSSTYDRLLEESKKNPKVNWSRHTISGIIAGAIIFFIAIIVYSYIVREEDFNIRQGDGLAIARAFGHTITPFIDVVPATASTQASRGIGSRI